MRKRIVAGNWKMNMNKNDAFSLFDSLNNASLKEGVNVIIAPPSIYLSAFSKIKNGRIYLAAQNCSENKNGAFTGEISAEMLASIDVSYCLVGHSERRQYQKESDALLQKKIDALLTYNITPIFCCGENLQQREAFEFFSVIQKQLENTLFHLTSDEITKVVIAYEPIWAIGTGKTASSNQAQEIHAFIRTLLTEKYSETVAEKISILYGGSCNPSNAKELFSNKDIDGGLIGGAALDALSFSTLIASF